MAERAVDTPTALPAEFAALARKFTPLVHSLVVDNASPSEIPLDALLCEIGIDPRQILSADNRVHTLRVERALDAAACEALRGAVDVMRTTRVDSVDGAADHQRPLSLEELESLIGARQAETLCSLPAAFSPVHEQQMRPTEIFVRRYTGATRPWNPFHQDSAAVTINVALNNDAEYAGGRLLAVLNDQVASISRAEGEATVHDSRLLHAVSRMVSGVRYSLIMFFGEADPLRETEQERKQFDDYMASLSSDDERSRVLSELAAAEAPVALELKRAESFLTAAKEQAPYAKALIEQARAEVARAEEAWAQHQAHGAARDDSEETLQAARARLERAVRSAQAKREQAFNAQVRVMRVQLKLATIRRETRTKLISLAGASRVVGEELH